MLGCSIDGLIDHCSVQFMLWPLQTFVLANNEFGIDILHNVAHCNNRAMATSWPQLCYLTTTHYHVNTWLANQQSRRLNILKDDSRLSCKKFNAVSNLHIKKCPGKFRSVLFLQLRVAVNEQNVLLLRIVHDLFI